MSQPPLCGPPAPSSQVHLQRRGPGSHHLSSCRRAASCIRASAAFQPSCAFSLIVAVGQRGEPAFHRHIYDPGAFQPGRNPSPRNPPTSWARAPFPGKTPSRWMEKGRSIRSGMGTSVWGPLFSGALHGGSSHPGPRPLQWLLWTLCSLLSPPAEPFSPQGP